jgi:hypothetical protein
VTNPNLFSNCSRFATSTKDVTGYCGNFHLYCRPLELCDPDPCVSPTVLGGVCPWQVGIVGALVPRHGTACTSDALCKTRDSDDEALVLARAARVFPGRSLASILEEATSLAGLAASSSVAQTIVSSDSACMAALALNGGDTRVPDCQIRRSWLVRHPAIGLPLEDENVRAHCVHLPAAAKITNGVMDPAAACDGNGCVGPKAGPLSANKPLACQAQKDLFHIFHALSPS